MIHIKKTPLTAITFGPGESESAHASPGDVITLGSVGAVAPLRAVFSPGPLVTT